VSDERKPDFESEGVPEVDLADVPTEIGILPLRDTLLFPQAILPLAVARESSVALVNDAVKERKVIGVVTQRDPAIDEPAESDLYGIGTLTHIHKMFRFPDGSLRLVVQGIQRFRIVQVTQYRPFLKARVELVREEMSNRAADRMSGEHPPQDVGHPHEVVEVTDEDAIETTRSLGRDFGLLVGISSGANVWAARQVAKRVSGNVATVLPDRAERYFSTALL